MGVVVKFGAGDLELALAATLCMGCGGAKREHEAICGSCLAALPLYLRGYITGDRGPMYPEAFRRAVQHLTDIRELRNRHWSYRSMDELRAAGFKEASDGQCEARGCLKTVLWLWTPKGGRMPVDPRTLEPHSSTCLDPIGVVLRRIRRAATPAGRRRKARADRRRKETMNG